MGKICLNPLQDQKISAILLNSYIKIPAEEWTKVHSSLLVWETLRGVEHYAVKNAAINRERKYSVSKREEYEQKTEELLEPIVSALGFELVDVEYVKEGGTWYLRAYIDKPGGITVDDCEAVSRQFSDILDEKDYIPDSYVFEVSSPGLGRPLKKEKDFKRSLGEEVEIRTYRAIDRQKEFTGILKAYDENTVTIAYEDDTEQTFERADIALIRLALDF